MPEDKSLDLTGIGKAAGAIPPEAWGKAVEAACDVARECLAPVTAVASGVGRLIQARFDRLVEAEKINAAAVLAKTRQKIEQSGQPICKQIEPRVVVPALENAGLQSDPVLSELWSNLLAQEFIGNAVHPEFSQILARLTPEDAHTLADVDKRKGRVVLQAAIRATMEQLGTPVVRVPSRYFSKPSLSQAVLTGMNLIHKGDGGWRLTAFGEAFIKAVTDPSMKPAEQTSTPSSS